MDEKTPCIAHPGMGAVGASREMAKRSGKSLRTIQYWLAEMLDQLRERLSE